MNLFKKVFKQIKKPYPFGKDVPFEVAFKALKEGTTRIYVITQDNHYIITTILCNLISYLLYFSMLKYVYILIKIYTKKSIQEYQYPLIDYQCLC